MTDAHTMHDPNAELHAKRSTTGRPALRPPTRPPWHGMPDLLRVVWTMPRATVRWVLDHGDGGLWIPLALGAALVQALSSTALWGRIDLLGPSSLLRTIAIGWPLWIVAFFATAFGLAQIGQAFGGVGTNSALRSAVAWGATPVSASLPFVIAWLYGIAMPNEFLAVSMSVVSMVLWIWGAANTVFAVSEAHLFGTRRATITTLVYGALVSGALLAFGAKLVAGP
jgi:hypothetical protein